MKAVQAFSRTVKLKDHEEHKQTLELISGGFFLESVAYLFGFGGLFENLFLSGA